MLRICLVLFVLLSLPPATVLAEGGAPQVQKVEASKKAQGLVEKAAALIKEKGQEKAFVEINNVKGDLVDGEFYVFVIDPKGKTLAHGGNSALIGKDMWDLRDPDGVYFIREFVKVSDGKEGKGWVDYKWPNPVTKRPQAKTTFVMRQDGVVLGCGFYK